MPPKKGGPGASAAAQFVAPGYLVAAKSAELVPRMRACFDWLRGLEQADADKLPPGLENVATQLLHDTLRKSKHAEVRCLAAQCAVEILRVYAPTPPYDEGEQKVRAAPCAAAAAS